MDFNFFDPVRCHMSKRHSERARNDEKQHLLERLGILKEKLRALEWEKFNKETQGKKIDDLAKEIDEIEIEMYYINCKLESLHKIHDARDLF